jgi:hypothetical protein
MASQPASPIAPANHVISSMVGKVCLIQESRFCQLLLCESRVNIDPGALNSYICGFPLRDHRLPIAIPTTRVRHSMGTLHH